MKYIIYRISVGDYIYIGSTVDFKQRTKAHKCACETKQVKVYQMIRQAGGWNKCDMVPIEEFECETILESRIREEYWRREYNANMNSVRAHVTEEERMEEKKEYNKEYNKEYHKEYGKKYRQENKETINAKHTCVCGGKYTYSNKAYHEKSQKHIKYLEEQSITI